MRPSTRRLRIVAAIAMVLTGLSLVLATPASASGSTAIVDDGWWWKAQQGIGVELPPPPGVDDDELVVQSTASPNPEEATQAYFAIAAEIADGRTNPVLTLDVAEDGDQGGESAILLACHAGAAWSGVHNGAWDSKPPADCSTSVTGQRSEDGSQWVFPVGSLQFNDKLNIVVVPGIPADGLPGTFQIVFSAPTAASITTVEGDAPIVTTTPPTTVAPSAPPATSAPTAGGGNGSGGGFAAPPATQAPPATVAPPVPEPTVGAAPALPAEDQGQTATAPQVVEATQPLAAPAPVADIAEPRTVARVVGMLVLLLGLAGGGYAWRGPALAAEPATVDAPVEGGLARFRTQRTAEPTSIS